MSTDKQRIKALEILTKNCARIDILKRVSIRNYLAKATTLDTTLYTELKGYEDGIYQIVSNMLLSDKINTQDQFPEDLSMNIATRKLVCEGYIKPELLVQASKFTSKDPEKDALQFVALQKNQINAINEYILFTAPSGISVQGDEPICLSLETIKLINLLSDEPKNPNSIQVFSGECDDIPYYYIILDHGYIYQRVPSIKLFEYSQLLASVHNYSITIDKTAYADARTQLAPLLKADKESLFIIDARAGELQVKSKVYGDKAVPASVTFFQDPTGYFNDITAKQAVLMPIRVKRPDGEWSQDDLVLCFNDKFLATCIEAVKGPSKLITIYGLSCNQPFTVK